MSSQRKAGVFLGYLNIIAKNLVNLVYTPMLLSFVGQADYGIYQSANSFVFSLSLLSFGFSEAYIRFYTQRKAQGTDADIRVLNGMYLALYCCISLVALAVGLAFSASASLVFGSSFTEDQVGLAHSLMAVMAFNVSLTLFSTVFDAYILAHEQFRFQQSRQIFTTFATPFVALALLYAGLGVIGVAVAQLSVTVALLLLNARFAVGKLGMRFDLSRFDRPLFKGVAAFSGWIFLNQVCDLVNQSLPNVLLGAISGATAVAVFAVSVQIRQVFYSLSLAISNVFVPLVNRIVAESDDNDALTRLMTRVGRYQLSLFCFVYGGFALLGQFFISKWAGPSFGEAYPLILAMTLPVSVPLCQNVGIEIQRAKNRHKARSIVYCGMAFLNVLFTVVAAPYIGVWAPAIGYIASIALGNGLFMNWYYHKRIGLDMAFFWRNNLPVFAAMAIALAIGMIGTSFIPVEAWITFIGWGVVYSALYAAALWFIALNNDEKKAVLGRLAR